MDEDEDDFFARGDTGHRSVDLGVEQRATERKLNELTVSGYRDGRARHSDDEALIQLGFDLGYKQLARIAFASGQLKAACFQSTRAQLARDSAFMARLAHKLEQLETHAYERVLRWHMSPATSGVDVSADELARVLASVERRLVDFKTFVMMTPPAAAADVDGHTNDKSGEWRQQELDSTCLESHVNNLTIDLTTTTTENNSDDDDDEGVNAVTASASNFTLANSVRAFSTATK